MRVHLVRSSIRFSVFLFFLQNQKSVFFFEAPSCRQLVYVPDGENSKLSSKIEEETAKVLRDDEAES